MSPIYGRILASAFAFVVGLVVTRLKVPSPAPITLFGVWLVLCMTLGTLVGK